MFSVFVRSDQTYVAVHGDLDESNLPQFRHMLETLFERPGARVHLDLTACTYANSAAISVLLKVRRERGESLSIGICSSGGVYRIFEICGLIGTVATAEDRPARSASLR